MNNNSTARKEAVAKFMIKVCQPSLGNLSPYELVKMYESLADELYITAYKEGVADTVIKNATDGAPTQ
jgi:hypothetical protein